jgi:hypothetical protein
MMVIFFIPLSLIALFESTLSTTRNSWVKHWLRSNDEGEADDPSNRDPQVEEEGEDGEGLVISREKFSDLVKVFPDTQQVRLGKDWWIDVDVVSNSRVKRQY